MDQLLHVVKDHWQMIAASAGPLAASMVARLIFGKNKLMLMVVRGSMAWLVIQVTIGPYMKMAKENVEYLIQLTSR